MRLRRFLNEEYIIKKALSMDEPEKGMIIDPEEVEEMLDVLNRGLEAQKKKTKYIPKTDMDKSDKAILNDIKDKIMKWEEVLDKLEGGGEEEEVPPEEGEEAPPEEEEEEAPPEKIKKSKKGKKSK